MFKIGKHLRMVLLGIIAAAALSACTVTGVDDYQRAMHLGCTPAASGGVVCSGEKA